MKISALNPDKIQEIVQPIFAPLAWLKDGRVFPIDKEPLLIEAYCAAHKIPRTKRYDAWADILEPFLDTEFSPEDEARTMKRLVENGFSESEILDIRAKVGDTVLGYNSSLWEWVYLGLGDLYQAYRYSPPKVNAEFLIWASEIAHRPWKLSIAKTPEAPGPPANTEKLLDLEPGGLLPAGATDDFIERMDKIDKILRSIEAQMAGPGRAYHNLRHINEALELGRLSYYNQVKDLGTLSSDPSYRALNWAILFHDYVYVAGAKDNEQLSAKIAHETLMELGVPKEAVLTQALIEWTKTHDKKAATTKLTRAMYDADMGIFGLNPVRYDQYTDEVRAEWVGSGVVSDEQFNIGRAQFLQKVLSENKPGEFFFALDPFHSKMAWENISRELERLGKKSYS